jgi:mono/diheme cytochrome c family protein
MKIKNIVSLALVLILVGTVAKASEDPSLDEGKSIFTSRCAACHNINKILTGPALAGVEERRSIDWILNFVRSSQSMVKKGDKDAVALFEKFNKIPMPDHPDMTPERVKNILTYIKSETKPITADKAPFAKPSKLRPNFVPLSIAKDSVFFISFLAVVIILIGSMLFAVHVRNLKGE